MLNQIISTMIVGGMTLIGAVVTMAPENVRAPTPLTQSTKSDMVTPLPFLTDDSGMRMRAVYRKPEEPQKTIAVAAGTMGRASSLTVMSPYLTPASLRMAIRVGWAFGNRDD